MNEALVVFIAVFILVSTVYWTVFIIGNYHRQLDDSFGDMFGTAFYCDVKSGDKVVGAARIKKDLTEGRAVYELRYVKGLRHTKLDPFHEYKSVHNFGTDYRLVYAKDEEAAKRLYWADRRPKLVVEKE